MVKIFDIKYLKEELIRCIEEKYNFLNEISLPFIIKPKIYIDKSFQYMIYERTYCECNLYDIILSNCLNLSHICLVMISLSKALMILSEYDIKVSNLKSKNIIYKSDEDSIENLILCDLWIDRIRKSEEKLVDDMCFTSPEELSESECNEKSVVWSMGCILNEMMDKRLPSSEDNEDDCNNLMNLMFQMLIIKNVDRISLYELNKELVKGKRKYRNSNGELTMDVERKEMLYKNDSSLKVSFHPPEYYIESDKWKDIRDKFIESYNKSPSEKILSILLKAKLNGDEAIKDKLRFQKYHKCKLESGCYLDKKILNIKFGEKNIYAIEIDSDCMCCCEEGINYFFRILTPIKPHILKFKKIFIPIKHQPSFGLGFAQFTELLSVFFPRCRMTSNFIKYFVKSIPLMVRLKYVDLTCIYYSIYSINFEIDNPIGPTGFKLLSPYLHLLIDKKRNQLDLTDMNLNNESMSILLSKYNNTYSNLSSIFITSNKSISSTAIKSLLSKFYLSQLKFDYEKNELYNDKTIPRYIDHFKIKDTFLMVDSGMDDNCFKTFISLRLKELRVLDGNKLTHKSIEILINSLSSLPRLKEIQLEENPIGDSGMKILSQHIHLLEDFKTRFCCEKMGLSSTGLKYLLDGLKNIQRKIRKVDISNNNIDSSGIEYLMNYMKKEKSIQKLKINGNPIGNAGFKLLSNNLEMMIDQFDEIDLSNISIDDESVILLRRKLDSIDELKIIILKGNNIRMNGLKSICEKTVEYDDYPFIEMNCSCWTNEELKYYLDYCVKKRRRCDKFYDFSNLNVNDSHISLIKKIKYVRLGLSNNKLTAKGLKELTDSLFIHAGCISIFGNEIGDEGVEVLCKYFDKFVDLDNWGNSSSLNLSNIGMSEKGLKMIIESLKDFQALEKIDISGNELNESGLRLMKENKEVFECLEKLSITVKENINKSELKSFLETFSSIGLIKVNGVSEEEKKKLSKNFLIIFILC